MVSVFRGEFYQRPMGCHYELGARKQTGCSCRFRREMGGRIKQGAAVEGTKIGAISAEVGQEPGERERKLDYWNMLLLLVLPCGYIHMITSLSLLVLLMYFRSFKVSDTINSELAISSLVLKLITLIPVFAPGLLAEGRNAVSISSCLSIHSFSGYGDQAWMSRNVASHSHFFERKLLYAEGFNACTMSHNECFRYFSDIIECTPSCKGGACDLFKISANPSSI